MKNSFEINGIKKRWNDFLSTSYFLLLSFSKNAKAFKFFFQIQKTTNGVMPSAYNVNDHSLSALLYFFLKSLRIKTLQKTGHTSKSKDSLKYIPEKEIIEYAS
ncbi:MAG TPA: hypothetical protein VD908_18880 [Cytophagales bacterium]|nr:hypothetical protein [Cytophagales bacterium]